MRMIRHVLVLLVVSFRKLGRREISLMGRLRLHHEVHSAVRNLSSVVIHVFDRREFELDLEPCTSRCVRITSVKKIASGTNEIAHAHVRPLSYFD